MPATIRHKRRPWRPALAPEPCYVIALEGDRWFRELAYIGYDHRAEQALDALAAQAEILHSHYGPLHGQVIRARYGTAIGAPVRPEDVLLRF